MIDKNLLVIAPSYTSYVKNQVEAIASHFNHVYVLVRLNPIAEISKILPINYLKPFTKSAKINEINKPENVTVIPTLVYYIPTKMGRQLLYKSHYHSVEKTLKKYNIKFDLIHAHFTSSSGYVGARLKYNYNKPLIITVHENRDWLITEYESKNKNVIYAWKTADILCRVNSVDIPILKQFNSNVLCIANGFDENHLKQLDRVECRNKLGLPSDAKIIFSLGLLIERKGYDDLIDAIHRITLTNRKILCYIGGHGKIKNKLQNKINKYNLQDTVKLLGFIEDDLIPIWMNACDVFVLPSHSEGNPTVMFESLGCGIPFIGTNVGGIPEIITSPKYGLVSDPKNVESLAINISNGLDCQWDQSEIHNYAKNFTWKSIGKNYLILYQSLI